MPSLIYSLFTWPPRLLLHAVFFLFNTAERVCGSWVACFTVCLDLRETRSHKEIHILLNPIEIPQCGSPLVEREKWIMIYPSWSESCTGSHPKYAWKAWSVWVLWSGRGFSNVQPKCSLFDCSSLRCKQINATSATEDGSSSRYRFHLCVCARLPRGALPSNHDSEEHLTVPSCLREENSVPGLRLSAYLSKRLHAPWKPEGGVPGLWELDG